MDLRHLEFAVAVAEEGGFTAAARRLHTGQSTVSTVVQALERDLGTPLFQRSTHHVRLTPAGADFLPAARAALQAAEHARSIVDTTRRGPRGDVTIGVTPGSWPQPHRVLGAVRRTNPGITVHVRQMTCADSTVDILVTDRAPGALVVRPWRKEELVLVTCAEIPSGPVTPEDAAEIAVVDFAPGWAVRTAADRAFRTAGLTRRVRFEAHDFAEATELIRYGLGGCLLPASTADGLGDLAVHRFTRNAPVLRVVVAHADREPSPAVAAVLGQFV